MSKNKYEFIVSQQEGKSGEWQTADGFRCFTDKRATAIRWYKQFLKDKTLNK